MYRVPSVAVAVTSACGPSSPDVVRAAPLRSVSHCARSAIVIPVVLYLSALLLQVALYALYRPVRQVLDRLATRSQLSTFRSGTLSTRNSVDSVIQKLLGIQSQSSSYRTPRAADEEAPSAQERVEVKNSFTSAPSTSSWITAALPALPSPQYSQCVDAATQAGAQRSFLQFLADTSIATALGVSLLMYTQIAKVACGLLMCVSVGQTTRWVLDVRLQCPSLPPYPVYGPGAVVFGVLLVLGCIAWPVTLAGVLIHHAHQGRLMRLGHSQPATSSTARRAHTKDAAHAAGGVGGTSGAGVSRTAQHHDADTIRRPAVRTTARLAVRYSD